MMEDRLIFSFDKLIVEVNEMDPVCKWDKIQITGYSNVGKTYINFFLSDGYLDEHYRDGFKKVLGSIFNNLFVICKPNSEDGALPFVKNRKVDSETIQYPKSRDVIMKPYKIIIDTDCNKLTVSGRMFFKFGHDEDDNDVIVSDIKVHILKELWKNLYGLKPLLFKDTPSLHPDKVICII